MREYVGWLVAALILLFHVFSTELSQRLDWVNFGSEYRAQIAVFGKNLQAVNDAAGKALQAQDVRLKALEQKAGANNP